MENVYVIMCSRERAAAAHACMCEQTVHMCVHVRVSAAHTRTRFQLPEAMGTWNGSTCTDVRTYLAFSEQQPATSVYY